MMLWSSNDADLATGGHSSREWAASGVSIDSRSLDSGDLFVALRDRRDGHDFVAAAFKGGASASLVSRKPRGVPDDAALLVVDDVQEGLKKLGVAGRTRSKARIVAVTGSVGKTSSKEMLRLVLSKQGKTHVAERSFNNHWGVPLTLAKLPSDADYAVVEIGMNRRGEIGPLSNMTRPNTALITRVASAHLEALGSLDEIAAEKAEVFSGLEPGGTAIVNIDSPASAVVLERAQEAGAKMVTFGRAAGADWRLVDARVCSEGTVVRAVHGGRSQIFRLAARGRHFAANALGVLAAAADIGVDPVIAAIDLRDWTPPPGRGNRHSIVLDGDVGTRSICLLDDAYNANPASLAAALEVLAETALGNNCNGLGIGRRIAVLGDMLELGSAAVDLHASFADHPSMGAISLVHCSGPLMRNLYDALPADKRGCWCESAQSLAAKAHRLAGAGDVVLVKGSKGSQISLVAQAIRNLGWIASDTDLETE